MPTTSETRPGPGDQPGLEARLRAELGAGGLPAEVRQRQLTRLQELAAELGPTATAGAATAGATPAATRARQRWFTTGPPSRAAAASVAAVAVLVLGSGSAVAASAGALPGETMYPVKQAVEHVQVAAAWSASREVAAYLDVADTRLEEAGRLVAGEGELDELSPTLDRHEDALASAAERAGDDPALARTVDEATAAAATRLGELRDALPETASPQAGAALDRALQRLQGPGRQPEGGSDAPERSPRGDEPAPGEPGEPAPAEPGTPPEPGPEPRPEPGQEPGVRQDPGAPRDPGGQDRGGQDRGGQDRGGQDRGAHEPGTSGDPGPPQPPGDPDSSAGASEQGQPDDPAATDTGGPSAFDAQQYRTRPSDDADGSQDAGQTDPSSDGSASDGSGSDQSTSGQSTSDHTDGADHGAGDDAEGGR